jgi:hypothetical protein
MAITYWFLLLATLLHRSLHRLAPSARRLFCTFEALIQDLTLVAWFSLKVNLKSFLKLSCRHGVSR